MIMLKIGICAAIAYIAVTSLCKLIFIRALKCNKCGKIIPEDEHRGHSYRCNQKD
jgi:hypothetical protein